MFRQARTTKNEFGIGRVVMEGEKRDPWPEYLRAALEKRFEYDPLNQDFVQRYKDVPVISKFFPRWRAYGRARADMKWFSRLLRYMLGRMGALEATAFGIWNNLPPASEEMAEQCAKLGFSMYEDYDKTNFDKVDDHKEFGAVDF